jgi:hypothetical protein
MAGEEGWVGYLMHSSSLCAEDVSLLMQTRDITAHADTGYGVRGRFERSLGS